jgi:hypothetical protein
VKGNCGGRPDWREIIRNSAGAFPAAGRSRFSLPGGRSWTGRRSPAWWRRQMIACRRDVRGCWETVWPRAKKSQHIWRVRGAWIACRFLVAPAAGSKTIKPDAEFRRVRAEFRRAGRLGFGPWIVDTKQKRLERSGLYQFALKPTLHPRHGNWVNVAEAGFSPSCHDQAFPLRVMTRLFPFGS